MQFNKIEKASVRGEVLCSDFRKKLYQFNVCNRGKWQRLKIVRFIVTYISHTYGIIKPPCQVAIIFINLIIIFIIIIIIIIIIVIIIIINLFHFDFKIGRNVLKLYKMTN